MPLFGSIVLGVVSALLANFITELVKGKSKSIKKVDIENNIKIIIQKYDNKIPSYYENIIFEKVVREIEIILKRDPDLKITDDNIELVNPVDSIIPIYKHKIIKNDIEKRLKRLNEIIEQRRKELINSREIKPVIWKKVKIEDEPEAIKVLKDMEDRIRRRRLGEDVTNE